MSQNPTPLTPDLPQNNKDWDRLSPAIKGSTADSLLSARRQERQTTLTPAPPASPETSPAQTPSSQQTSPWTSPLPITQQETTPDSAPETTPAPADTPSILDAEADATERAEARDIALQDRPRWLKLRRTIIALAVPVLTIMLGIRAVASPAFLWLEYHRPGFPADSYGFDTQERLRLGSYGLDYVLNLAPHTYLADIQTSGLRAFLPTEVEHMTDVKRVLLTATVASTLLLIAALLSARSLRVRAPGTIRSALFTGTWITLISILALGLIGFLGWEAFFTTFHQIFFPQGNWQFRMSDTLIRLYPPQFWIDSALVVAGIVLTTTITLMALTWPTKFRKQLAHKRQEERLEIQALLRTKN